MDKKKLGEGSYGSVCKANNISTKAGHGNVADSRPQKSPQGDGDGGGNMVQAIRAVKTISKSQMKNLERFKQEIVWC